MTRALSPAEPARWWPRLLNLPYRRLPVVLLLTVVGAIIAGGHLPLRAVELVAGPLVESTSPTNVVVRWVTDVACGTRVQFGAAPAQLNRRVDGEVGTNHLVTLSGLQPATRYFYTVGTARYALGTNSFATLGRMSATAAGTATNLNAPSPPPGQWKPPPAPSTRETWGNVASLPDHFQRHGADFAARSADEYAALAWQFLQRAKVEALPMKRDEEGVLRVFDPKTRAFAAYNRDGTTKTFFKPQSRDYFDRQPGRPVHAKDLK